MFIKTIISFHDQLQHLLVNEIINFPCIAWVQILVVYIKVLKSLKQFFEVKKVVANFLSNFLFFLKMSYLMYSVLRNLRQLFVVKKSSPKIGS